MLRLGVFGGKYMTDCRREFPETWFERAPICAERHDSVAELFRRQRRQPLAVWRRNSWLRPQIRAAGSNGIAATTWAAAGPTMTRGRLRAGGRWRGTSAQIQQALRARRLECRKRQRQALLHWAYDSRKI